MMQAAAVQPAWHDELRLISPAAYLEPRWYAAYTAANFEKKIAEQLSRRDVEHFLPSYLSVRRWKDRRVRLTLPLFPGYIFVHLPWRDQMQVLQIPGVVRLVSFNGVPEPLPEREIETLRKGLSEQLRAKPHPFLKSGRHVRIRSGPLRGLEGVVVRRKGNLRVVVSLDLLRQSMSVDLDLGDLEFSEPPRG
jgi:transcription antitermination factor NusG